MTPNRRGNAGNKKDLKPDVAIGYTGTYKDKKTGQTKKYITLYLRRDLIESDADRVTLVGFINEGKEEGSKAPDLKFIESKERTVTSNAKASAGAARSVKSEDEDSPF